MRRRQVASQIPAGRERGARSRAAGIGRGLGPGAGLRPAVGLRGGGCRTAGRDCPAVTHCPALLQALLRATMTGSLFKANFWCSDILSTVGYDSIIQHLNNGRKNCKEFEDFLKERASIEEKYGKDLLNLSRKKPCGQSEINTLKRALEVFKQQVDNVAQCHIQLAQTLREEARKMEEFREKQKLQQKKTELIMDAAHKQKSLQFKKTMDAKKNYEQKCRDKDEAEQAVHRSANLVNPKQQEKLFVKLATSKTAVEDSDKAYMLHVNTLDKIREEWQSEHIKACQVFEAQECERINFFRNALWLHMNQLSQQCVTSDNMYEEVRKSLEMCSIEKDIEYFVNQRKTGQTPPAPIMYENFYSPQKNAAPPGKATGPNVARRGPLPVPKSLPGDPDYSLIGDYSLIYQ
ncbi:proline-serine-threonine phosphatase-interacting protein 2 [Equus asinus]|uniref:Proline-serine-threonine phosphatase-interacting protein 2 n=3 Tax=Equus TaxID=9789 RepID=A0A9L0SEM0_HORSE|nr:proline-serine-threonine phosphatase-interacting protein 2 [Equus asinus]XP_023503504.1 proline-serine-threonine phosphatase-interacting protein 2 isoform X2 [Equus caballus]